MRYLTVTLMRGWLAPKTMELFGKVDITYEGTKDKSSRKLIFVNGGLGIRFFLTRVSSVSTYVECGAADIDISGKDAILKEGQKLREVLDLGSGRYRMCVCEPESARELLQRHEMIRVMAKYPGITRDYFYNRKRQTMEIIKLNGSTELASIVELSGATVDIVETGFTLRGSGLVVLEEVCDLSVKVIVSQMSIKRENERATKLIYDLREALAGEDAGR